MLGLHEPLEIIRINPGVIFTGIWVLSRSGHLGREAPRDTHWLAFGRFEDTHAVIAAIVVTLVVIRVSYATFAGIGMRMF